MKTILKTALLSVCAGLLYLIDVPPEFPLRVEFVSEANAIFGVRRRAVRRGVIIGSSAAAANSAQAQSQPAAAPPPAPAATPAPAPAPAVDSKPLPLGTVVPSLPAGCTSTPVDGIDYQYCGGNFYRAVFQGNTLVYVTAKP
jgi:hypothetical protein